MIQEYRQPIIVDISDLYGFQRKAQYKTLIDNFNTKQTAIVVTIKWFKDGIEVNDIKRGIQPYEKEIIADNTVLADMTTGLPVMSVNEFNGRYKELITNEDGITIEQWKPDTPTTYMGESDFYCYIRDHHPVILKDLIIDAIVRANQREIL